MSEPRPVIVIHGIGNRDAQDFGRTVERIGRELGDGWTTLDFYWGDLGGVSEGLIDALPALWPPSIDSDESLTREAGLVRAELLGTMGHRLAAAQIICEAAVGPELPTVSAVRSEDEEATREAHQRTVMAIEEAVANSIYVQHLTDAHALQSIGLIVANAVAEADAQAGAGSSVQVLREARVAAAAAWIRDQVSQAIGLVDQLIGQVTSGVGGTFNQWLRGSLARPIALTLGDIVGYHQNRERILERLFAFVAERLPGWGGEDRPVSVMAHSLGGLLVLDAALGAFAGHTLWIDRLLTFGSQPAFFHIMTPRLGLQPYQARRRSRLPASIASWSNLWHPLDPLAFVVEPVFELSSGKVPEDIPVRTGARTIADHNFWLHSVYWTSAELIDTLKAAPRQR